MLTKIIYNNEADNVTYGRNNTMANKVFGFWIYLMSDCILFATLFSTYAVLVNGTAGGPTGKEIFELPFVLVETFCLLFSGVTYGMTMLAVNCGNNTRVKDWLVLTFLFGLGFISMELIELHQLIITGLGPERSAFLSSFFVLIVTHGLHVISGLIWILVMIVQVHQRGLTLVNQTNLQLLSLFWHFLDIVWICLFTVVYLLGAL